MVPAESQTVIAPGNSSTHSCFLITTKLFLFSLLSSSWLRDLICTGTLGLKFSLSAGQSASVQTSV
jgi:hypothetical protein